MEAKVIDEQKKTAEIVEQLMKEDARCRDSDLWLIYRFWRDVQKINVFIPFDKMDKLRSAETIRRSRQKIQNTDGKYLPTSKEIAKKRRIKEEVMKQYYGSLNRWTI